MARRKKTGGAMPELNLTSMMDVTFQLIIFFILVTNFAAAERPKLELPKPVGSKAHDPEKVENVVINILPEMIGNKATGRSVGLIVDSDKRSRSDYAYITEYLKKKVLLHPEIKVILRADKNLFFEEIQPVMQAITLAGIAHIDMSALAEEK